MGHLVQACYPLAGPRPRLSWVDHNWASLEQELLGIKGHLVKNAKSSYFYGLN